MGTQNNKQQQNSVAFSSQVNFTDWVTITSRRILVPTFVDRGALLGQRGRSPTVVNLSFLDRSRYFLFQVASSFIITRLGGPRSTPTATQDIR
jgi:hypothetical protein